jgi:hypothetical protein
VPFVLAAPDIPDDSGIAGVYLEPLRPVSFTVELLSPVRRVVDTIRTLAIGGGKADVVLLIRSGNRLSSVTSPVRT